MPLPKPKKDETRRQFISRCIKNKNINKEAKNKDQKLAICYNQWKNK